MPSLVDRYFKNVSGVCEFDQDCGQMHWMFNQRYLCCTSKHYIDRGQFKCDASLDIPDMQRIWLFPDRWHKCKIRCFFKYVGIFECKIIHRHMRPSLRFQGGIAQDSMEQHTIWYTRNHQCCECHFSIRFTGSLACVGCHQCIAPLESYGWGQEFEHFCQWISGWNSIDFALPRHVQHGF